MIDIENLKRHYHENAMIISLHAMRQAASRGIALLEIRECVMAGEIIEQYPDDFPFPSCLIYGKTGSGKILHIVASEEGANGRIIAAYVPNAIVFESDLKTRRERNEV